MKDDDAQPQPDDLKAAFEKLNSMDGEDVVAMLLVDARARPHAYVHDTSLPQDN